MISLPNLRLPSVEVGTLSSCLLIAISSGGGTLHPLGNFDINKVSEGLFFKSERKWTEKGLALRRSEATGEGRTLRSPFAEPRS